MLSVDPTNGAFTLLLVDDDPVNLKVLSEYLDGQGYQVLVARDGESAIARAHLARPDLILLDVMMPGIDGLETCRRLKADPAVRDIPVLFLTALNDVPQKVAGFEAGAVDYVTKPIRLEELSARIRTHLSIVALHRRLQEANDSLAERVAARTADLARRNRELTLLNRIIAASVSELDERAILAVACRELAEAFGLDHAEAILLDRERTRATVVAERPEAGAPSLVGEVLPPPSAGDAASALASPEPICAPDAGADPRLAGLRPWQEVRATASLLFIPLVIDGEVIGGLALGARRPRPFSPEEVELAWNVGRQVGGVMARLRLDEQRRLLQEQYYQSQKMEAIGKLAGGIAHDFNNILVPIMGYVDVALEALPKDQGLYADLKVVREAAERAAALTRQILAFARKQVLEMRRTSLNAVVSDFQRMLQRLIGEQIEVITVLQPDLHLVKADVGQMEQVLLNLVINARDAMPAGGKLVIETANVVLDESYVRRYAGSQPPGRYVMLAVSDTGHGMDAETQERMFQPFFTTKAVGKGTGLGLATVFGIVRQHGGNIWVYSEPGKGATFKMYLPEAEDQAAAPEAPPPEPTGHRGTETVLVVEDEGMVRRLVCQALAAYGYEVLEALGPRDAVRIAAERQGAIHLLLTDVIMPEMNGRELHREVVALHPEVRVLYMSGYTENVVAHHGVLDSGVNLLQKPFRVQELARRVRRALGS